MRQFLSESSSLNLYTKKHQSLNQIHVAVNEKKTEIGTHHLNVINCDSASLRSGGLFVILFGQKPAWTSQTHILSRSMKRIKILFHTLRILPFCVQSQRLKKILYFMNVLLHWRNINALNPEKFYIMYVFPERNMVPMQEVQSPRKVANIVKAQHAQAFIYVSLAKHIFEH